MRPRGKPGIEDILLTLESDTDAFTGQLRKARNPRGGPGNQPEKAMLRRQRRCGRLTPPCMKPNSDILARLCRNRKRLCPSRRAAMALAWSGYTAKANKLADALNREFPRSTPQHDQEHTTARCKVHQNLAHGARRAVT